MTLFRKILWLIGRNMLGFAAVSCLIVLLSHLPLALRIKPGLQDAWSMDWTLYFQSFRTYFQGLWHRDLGILPGSPWLRENPQAVALYVRQLVDRSAIVLIPAILLGIVVGTLAGASTFFLPRGPRRFFHAFNQVLFSMPDLMVIILLQMLAIWIDKQAGSPILQMVEISSRPAILLPIICVATPIAAYLFRYTIHACEEAMTREYVRTVQAKGLPRSTIFFKHVFRPATDSVLAVIPKMVAIATSSLLIVERLINIHGVTAPFNGLGVSRQAQISLLPTILICLAALVFLFSIATSLLRLWVNPLLRK